MLVMRVTLMLVLFTLLVGYLVLVELTRALVLPRLGRRLTCVHPGRQRLVGRLARGAANRRWPRLQAMRVDRIGARDAHTVVTLVQPRDGGAYLDQLRVVTLGLRIAQPVKLCEFGTFLEVGGLTFLPAVGQVERGALHVRKPS